MKQLQEVCNELQNENKIAIIRKYDEKSKFYMIIRQRTIIRINLFSDITLL